MNVDDIHGFDAEYIKTLENLSNSDISPSNKKLITNFANGSRHDALKKSTILGTCNMVCADLHIYQTVLYAILRHIFPIIAMLQFLHIATCIYRIKLCRKLYMVHQSSCSHSLRYLID